MEDKGKFITIETDQEEEDLDDLIIEEDEDEGMEEETEPPHPPKKFPAYFPMWKWNSKVPKDHGKTKSSLETFLLPNNINF